MNPPTSAASPVASPPPPAPAPSAEGPTSLAAASVVISDDLLDEHAPAINNATNQNVISHERVVNSDERIVNPSTGRSSFAGPGTPSSNSVGVSQGAFRGPLRRRSRVRGRRAPCDPSSP